MNRILDVGYCLSVPEKNDGCFIIKKVLGKGASSVTYLAECNQTEHVLKECNPLGLHMHRENDGTLVPDTELNKVKFEEYLSRFVDGASKQLAFRLTDDLKNTTSNIQAIYHANGTVYIDMTYFNGDTYDNIAEESLYDLLRRMKALAQVIGHYHDMGYLHLDIKPQNIYAIPETPEMVMMFDFDSVVPVADVEKMITLSYTDMWAAPEQKMAKHRHSICKATDLFAIGEIIFYRVMGRHSTTDERFDFSRYDYDKKAKIFENVNARIYRLLDELFRKTICMAPSNRFQTAGELINQLNSIIDILASTEPYLISTIKAEYMSKARPTKSLIQIHKKLQSTGRYFNKSTAKRNVSENAMEYIKTFGDYYEFVLTLDCNNGFIDTFLDIPIMNFKTDASTSTYERVLQVFNVLERVCDCKTLVVIDNFDERYLVDPRFASNTYYCDIHQVHDICLRLRFLNASVLINGAFDMTHFYKKEHYRHLHELLYNLAEKCYHKRQYSLANSYIKKAISIVQACSSVYITEYRQKDKALQEAIQIDSTWSVGYGFDADEIEIDSYLEQFEDCVDDI